MGVIDGAAETYLGLVATLTRAWVTPALGVAENVAPVYR